MAQFLTETFLSDQLGTRETQVLTPGDQAFGDEMQVLLVLGLQRHGPLSGGGVCSGRRHQLTGCRRTRINWH